MTRQMSAMSIDLKIRGTLANVLSDSSGPSVNHPNFEFKKTSSTLTNGLGNNQANRGWQSKSRTLSGGGSETLDIYDLAAVDIGAGAGNDGTGQAVVFEEIVAIAIVNENAIGADGALEIEPGAANGWTALGSHTVANGGALFGQGVLVKVQLDEAGFDIADASNHQLKFTATGGSVTYSIYLLGRHDDEESSSSESSSSTSSLSSSSSSSPSSYSSSSSSSATSSSWSSHSSSSSVTSSSSGTSSSSDESSSSWSAP